MIWTATLAVAAFLQLLAAYRALRLIGPSRGRLAWVLIASAFTLLGLRLVNELVLELGSGYRVSSTEEIMNLLVAGFCLAGVQRIKHLFVAMNHAETERQALLEEATRQRQCAEERASEAEEKKRTLDALMAHIPAGVAIVRAGDFAVRAISRHARELAGRPAEELERSHLGNHVDTRGVCHPDGSPARDDELPVVRAIRNGETVRQEEWGMRRADGSCYISLASAGPIRNAGGEITAGVVAWQDITELKAAQDELRQSYAQLQAVFEHMQEGLIFVNPQGRVLQRNPTALELLGYQNGEGDQTLQKSKEIFDLRTLEGGTLKPRDWPIRRTLRGETFTNMELRVRRQDSPEEKILSFGGTCVRNGEGKIALGLVTLHDVTATKETERTLRLARDAAEAANRAKGEFLANMSHELRTPMTAIMGLLDLLEGGKLQTDDQYFALARRSAERLLSLIEDLLDLSTIEAGAMVYDCGPFELHRNCRDAVTRMAAQAEAKGLGLAVEIAPDVPQLFIGDAKRVVQVLRNLIDNAIKFTERGEVRVRIALDDGGRLGEGVEGLLFSVHDSGIGIPRLTQQPLFESFRQADGSTTRRYGGAGLGLALCKRLVEGMGGCIGVESEEGRGSLFYFVLPLPINEKPVDSGATSNAHPPAGDFRRPKIF